MFIDNNKNNLLQSYIVAVLKLLFYSEVRQGGWDFIILSSPEFAPFVAQWEPALSCGNRKRWLHSRLPDWCAASSGVPPSHSPSPLYALQVPSISLNTELAILCSPSSLCEEMAPASLLSIKIEVWQQWSLNSRDKRQPCSCEFTFEVPSKFSVHFKILISLSSLWQLSFSTLTVKKTFSACLQRSITLKSNSETLHSSYHECLHVLC